MLGVMNTNTENPREVHPGLPNVVQDFCAKTSAQNPGVWHESEDSELNSMPKRKKKKKEKSAVSRNESKIKLEHPNIFLLKS